MPSTSSRIKDIFDPSRVTKRKLNARKREERLKRIEAQITAIARVLLDVSESVDTIKKEVRQSKQSLESEITDIKRLIYDTSNKQLRIIIEKPTSPQSPDH